MHYVIIGTRLSFQATHTCTWVHFDGALIGEWTDPIGQLTTTKVHNLRLL